MAVATVVKEPEAITLTSEWPGDEGFLETVLDAVIEHIVTEPDELDAYEAAILRQLDDDGAAAFVKFQDLEGARRIASVEAAYRLAEPVKGVIVQAMQENRTHDQLEKMLGAVAEHYMRQYGKPNLAAMASINVPDGAA